MESHEQLLSRWCELSHHRNKPFIKDGIIDIHRWEHAPRKVLLLLKEAYGEEDATEGYDLRKVIRDEWNGPKYKIWWTAAYWCYAIHHSKSTFSKFPSDDEAYALASESLLSSATINVKKSNGKSISDSDEITQHAMRDGDLIRLQIELINPEIVICGNTWGAVQHLWPDAVPTYDLVWKHDSRYFIDFWHPANQFPNALNYYALGCLLQNGGYSKFCERG
ncbi:MAG: hypothetical protein K2Y31_17170 [Burkholderiales bacterium]|nr:hypothetical protein [Burkholderiales bacterium]